MTTYRKRKDSDTWHWERDCSNYPPPSRSTSRPSKPSSGELCNECKAKAKRKK